jgi:hypothetical protein
MLALPSKHKAHTVLKSRTLCSCDALSKENQETFNLQRVVILDTISILRMRQKTTIIASVVFKLTKRNHKINTSYGDITNELAKTLVSYSKDVSNAVIAIRQSSCQIKRMGIAVVSLKPYTTKIRFRKNTSTIS